MVIGSHRPSCSTGRSAIAPKKVPPPFSILISTRSNSRMENHEVQKPSASVTEFNDMKSELKHLPYMMSEMMKRFESQPSLTIAHDSGFNPNYSENETSLFKIKYTCSFNSISRNLCQIWTIWKYLNMKKRYPQEFTKRQKRK